MRYVHIVDGAVATYPYSFKQLRAANSGVSFPREPSPELLAEWGVLPVTEVARPANTVTRNSVELDPVSTNGVWKRTWGTVPASADEIADRRRLQTRKTERAAVKADSFVANFIELSPNQVINHIDTNVTDLASAKAVIGKLALLLLTIAKQEYSE